MIKIIIIVLLSLIGVGTCLLIGDEPIGTDLTSEIDFNGKLIDFTYTDDNTGETLIIKTDKETYGGWESSPVYFSIENTSDDELVDIRFYFQGEEVVSKISEYKKDVPYQVTISDYGDVEIWDEELEATTTVERIIGNHQEERYKDEWRALHFSKGLKTIESLKSSDKIQYSIAKGETKYFQGIIEFPSKSEGEFYMEATGDKGGQGFLDPWYNSSWGYCRKITINNSEVSTTTALYPILATTTLADLKHTGSGGKVGQIDGYDIIFVAGTACDTAGSLLNYEREKYASTTGAITYWVETEISSTTDKYLLMYYGNAGASDTATTTGVWDDDYFMVQHLSEASITDSTQYDNDGSVTDATLDTTGCQFGNCYLFDSTSDEIEVPTAPTFLDDPLTISLWINISQLPSTPAREFTLWEKQVAAGHSIALFIENSNPNDTIRVYACNASGGCDFTAWDAALVSGDLNKWHHLVYVVDSGFNTAAYFNGVKQVATHALGESLRNDANNSVYIGNDGGTSSIEGNMDEVRNSSIARHAMDILTDYNSQVDNASFLTWGSEETEAVTRRIIPAH